ncbi:hypothetical protein GCM10022285_62560 [Streptomyces tunisiensis]|uniref:Uncharacterized protein n=1 Tax=Streptomyces tunisiensis TaxID=948699 RepID=A0ABP7ZA40_9ACTN
MAVGDPHGGGDVVAVLGVAVTAATLRGVPAGRGIRAAGTAAAPSRGAGNCATSHSPPAPGAAGVPLCPPVPPWGHPQALEALEGLGCPRLAVGRFQRR